MKYERAVKIFDKLTDSEFVKKYKKVNDMVIKDIKYSNLNSEPFKYYSLRLSSDDFKTSKDHRAFKTVLIYVFRGKLKKARKVLEKVEFNDPYYKSFLEGIYFSRYLSNPSRSTGKLLEALKSDTLKKSEVKFFLGKAYYEIGFYDLAERFLKECRKESSDMTIKTLAYDYLFAIYRKQKKVTRN